MTPTDHGDLQALTPITYRRLTAAERSWANRSFQLWMSRYARRQPEQAVENKIASARRAYQTATLNILKFGGLIFIAGVALLSASHGRLTFSISGSVVIGLGGIVMIFGYLRSKQIDRILRSDGIPSARESRKAGNS